MHFYFQKYLQASDFLQHVIYINLNISDEDKVSDKSRLLFSSAEMFKKPVWQTAWTQMFWVQAVCFFT